MMHSLAPLVQVLKERGLCEQVSHPLETIALRSPLRGYIGFDPTAPSLHLGNLLGVTILRWVQKMGHIPVILLGGATGRIGDPSGKSYERPILSEETLTSNISSLRSFFDCFFGRFDGPSPLILDNQEWYQGIGVIDFLRDVGKHFRVNVMLSKESVRTRLASEEGISFTEFSYQILQSYDFYYLHRTYGVQLQMGGSDQWGNITAGIEFSRRLGQEGLYGLTFPLLTDSVGKKFGKSEQGAIWLSEDSLSCYEFYQALVRLSDVDVIHVMKKLTFLPLDAIHEIERSMQSSSYRANDAQKLCAEEITRIVHGDEGLQKALGATQRYQPGSEVDLSFEQLESMAQEGLVRELQEEEVVGQRFQELACRVGLVSSRSEGTKLIQNGGAYWNNHKLLDTSFVFRKDHLIGDKFLLLSIGKKRRLLIAVRKSDLKNK
jgi:tyrosyl-tRNA synthetase